MSVLERQNKTVVDGIEIPEYGCLKLRELFEYKDFLKEFQGTSKEMLTVEANLELAIQCVTILLKRLDPQWTIEKTKADEWTLPIDGQKVTFQPDHILVDQLYDFWNLELHRGNPPKAEDQQEDKAESKGKQPTGRKST